MIKDLEIHGRTQDTIKNMLWSIKNFSKFYNQQPELLGEQDIYIIALIRRNYTGGL